MNCVSHHAPRLFRLLACASFALLTTALLACSDSGTSESGTPGGNGDGAVDANTSGNGADGSVPGGNVDAPPGVGANLPDAAPGTSVTSNYPCMGCMPFPP